MIIKFKLLSDRRKFIELEYNLCSRETIKGIYSYFQGRMVVFNTQDKSFEAFGVIGDEIKRTAAVKCE